MGLLSFYSWDARLRYRLNYTTIVLCFGTRDSAKNLAMRVLLFVLGRATQKQIWLCDCCRLCWDARLKRRLSYAAVVVSFEMRDSEEDWAV